MSLKKTVFTARLIKANGLDPDDFQSWAFWPGMLFNSADKWWGDYGRRDFPHEGVDFCLYKDLSGRVRRLDEQTRIPVMHDGVVRALYNDYLGHAVVLEHENIPGRNGKMLSVYAHTKPDADIRPGVFVKAGDIIATIADTRRSKANILPHLHISFGVPSPTLVYNPFVWNSMRDPQLVRLRDPLELIDRPHVVLDFQDQNRPFKVTPANGAVS